ncbi:hypothetical protein QCF18_10330 [Staphylococcus aureus]|jgi:hypothetical protein|uniref:Uncharacterized protein n=27 Tax=Kayvirus TaxID=1857843 RepID=I6XK79_9CAUD|nr:hypothetical protein [Staphylococcus aureus]YP_008873662.1 hypothetical protein X920_gp042 [Staphylococcus phage Sb1]YP_009041383.1 hypothetical protein CPT_phageK_gp105 [Staphylococcus phage K]YP_009098304.1 hypothetical protein QLX38_gp081 [Staphylococcus phage Team1]YP_009195982.1 hypothetical protein AVU41_gp146 [Staphylococcus phage phiIPLA-RODI]YP_009224576.1 hypothetical protein ST812_166 [Staphylococcus phage 812]YP_009780143.1 hypothetical protein QLX23_gp082 [Staphylococcus phage
MLKGFSEHVDKPTTIKTLYKTLTSGKVELLGVSYDSDYFPSGVTVQSYIEDIGNEDEGLQFVNKVNVVESMKQAVVGMNNQLGSSGLGYVRTEQLKKELEETGLMTDLLARGTNLTSTKKVDIVSTFIEPEVTYQNITIAKDIKLRLYKVEEESPLNGYTHIVYLLTTEKLYDGQTLFGMLSKKDKLSKGDTDKLLAFFRNNSLISKSVFCVKLLSKDYYFNLYNTHETGIFFLEDTDVITIACGQSYVKVNTKDIKSSYVKIEDKTHKLTELVINLKGDDTLTILF